MHGGVYAAVAPGTRRRPCPYSSTNDDPNDAALKQKADAFVRRGDHDHVQLRAWTQHSAIFIVADEGDFTGNAVTGGWDSPAGCCDSPVLPDGDRRPDGTSDGNAAGRAARAYGGGLVPAVVIPTTGRALRRATSPTTTTRCSGRSRRAWGLGYLGHAADRANAVVHSTPLLSALERGPRPLLRRADAGRHARPPPVLPQRGAVGQTCGRCDNVAMTGVIRVPNDPAATSRAHIGHRAVPVLACAPFRAWSADRRGQAVATAALAHSAVAAGSVRLDVSRRSRSQRGAATCGLAGGNVKHVIYLQFDNTHYTRDRPDVAVRPRADAAPARLPAGQRHAVHQRPHDPDLAHGGRDPRASPASTRTATGQTVSNSYDYYQPDGTPTFTSSFKYWTDVRSTRRTTRCRT